jgi:hypothetical protein
MTAAENTGRTGRPAGQSGKWRRLEAAMDPAIDPTLRMGGIALNNGLILVSQNHWAAAIRETDGTISVASGKKPRLPGSGRSDEAGGVRDTHGIRGARVHSAGRREVPSGAGGDREGIPLVRGLSRLGEILLVLGIVKKRLPSAQLPFEGSQVAAALATSVAASSAVRLMAPRSVLVQETGHALAAFVPAVLAVKRSPAAGYHGAEHKVIGAREETLRTARERGTQDETLFGDASAAAKEHDRCGSNLIGPLLVATVLTNVFARDKWGRRTPLRSAAAGAASLGIALEAVRWAGRHTDSLLARLMLMPGRTMQKSFTTSEPTPEQLEVGERALAELLRLENAGR